MNPSKVIDIIAVMFRDYSYKVPLQCATGYELTRVLSCRKAPVFSWPIWYPRLLLLDML